MTPRIPLPKTELEFRNASVRIDRIEIETVAKKVSRPTLSRWQKSGYLVPIKTGGRCRYRQSDIDAIQRK